MKKNDYMVYLLGVLLLFVSAISASRVYASAESDYEMGLKAYKTGSYTAAAARFIEGGCVVALDLQRKMIAYTMQRMQAEGIQNADGLVGDACAIPFADESFDAAFLITVIGEVPDPEGAMGEIYRILKPSGTAAFSELFIDPDYPLRRTLIRRAKGRGFLLADRTGSFFNYSLVFQKPES